MQPYGEDHGHRIIYTKLTHNMLEWKAQSMVNTDADEGVSVDLLRRQVRMNVRR